MAELHRRSHGAQRPTHASRTESPKREVRTYRSTELRAKDSENPGADGYAAVYNSVTDLGWFKETIAPGTVARALAEKQDVRCLQNHDPNFVLGRTKNNTLSLSEDTHGLKFDCDFPDTQAAKDLRTLMQRGDIDACSFAFAVRKQTWTERTLEDGTVEQLRTIQDVDLFDVSIVTYPAYEATSCEARSLWPDGMPKELRDRQTSGTVETRDPEDGDGDCECECPECEDGDCADCSDADCDDPNCNMDRSARKPGLEQRAEATKKVDGEDLTAECFLIVGDPEDTSTWKLPVNFSTEEKLKSHLRNALARFNQLKDVSEEQKSKSWKKLVRLCKKHDMDVADEKNSLRKHLTSDQIASFRDDMGDGMEACSSAVHRSMEQMSSHMDGMRAHVTRMDDGDADDAKDAVRCMRDAFHAMREMCSAGHDACDGYLTPVEPDADDRSMPTIAESAESPAISAADLAQARVRAILAALDSEAA